VAGVSALYRSKIFVIFLAPSYRGEWMKRILIVGATSAIAEATARKFAARGDVLFLAARNREALAAIANDLRLRGATFVGTSIFDALDLSAFLSFVTTALTELGGLDEALIAHGTLSDQSACETSVDVLQKEIAINAISVMAICLLLARIFSSQGRGVIAAISSVAGDRGRESNYIYGAAKAALGTFLSGLRQELHRKGIRVVTIKPGSVATPMTAGFKKGDFMRQRRAYRKRRTWCVPWIGALRSSIRHGSGDQLWL
jgi:decaprenylphospho-beta-D-erythro-pentofuranosid-2-ulose 2-reductase